MFQPLKLGALNLKHRVAMAPLTRTRADPLKLTPTDLSVEYYKQRASDGGLLISEAVVISPETMYGRAPGIWTDEQVSAWKKVCDAVHEKGGLISCQLWHIGRMAHPSFDNHPLNKASGGIYRSCVSASNIPAKGRIAEYGTGNLVPNATPRPLTIEEIEGRLVNDYVHAAKNAIKAGFDAVEVHSAHGYLLDQFLNSGTNNRTDKYGGSLENRFRIIDLIVSAISKEISPERVAVRLSPTTKTSMKYYGVEDTDPENLYYYVVSRLAKYNLAYLLLSEPRWTGLEEGDTDTKSQLPLINTRFRPVYPGKIIGAGGFSPNSARASIEKGEYDAIAFGRWFISNPDLPERLKDKSKELTIYNRKTFYVGKDSDADGYTDYPSLSAQKSSSKYRTVKQESIGANLANAKL